MTASPLINEEVLHAFVDGETDAQTNAMVLAYLSASPADATRVETWRRQNELIRASFARIEHEPVPLSLSLTQGHNFRSDTPVQLVSSGTLGHTEEPARSAKSGDLIRLCIAIGIAFAVGMLAALITPHLTSPLAEFVARRNLTAAETPDRSLSSRTLAIVALYENKNPAAIDHDDFGRVQVGPARLEPLRMPNSGIPELGSSKIMHVIDSNSLERDKQISLCNLHEFDCTEKPASTFSHPASETGAKDSTPQFPPEKVSLAPSLIHALAGSDLSITGFQTGSVATDPILCLFLATKAGEPLTLCREPVPEIGGSPENANFQVVETGSLRSAEWREKTERLALAGRLSETDLLDLSHRIHAQIAASGGKPN